MSNRIILGIESSCDDTGAAVLRNGILLSNCTASQFIHRQYGGVVPELASRAHQETIVPVVEQALQQANIQKNELTAVAFTRGPGLLGSLLVGTSFAKGLALALGIPLVAVDHMKAHILAHFLSHPTPSFPFLCLTVSGGHTQIVQVDSPLTFTLLGETQDDAVGEAFDKVAKLMGLPYPGGPALDALAAGGDSGAFTFPDTSMPGLSLSFSGIKTAFLYFLRQKLQEDPSFLSLRQADLAASIQKKLVDMVLEKLRLAAKETGIRQVAIAGGVSANRYLRETLSELGQSNGWQVFIPPLAYCTDNAAMIAMAGDFLWQAGYTSSHDIAPDPRLKF